MLFNDLEIHKSIKRALDTLEYKIATPIQEEAIPVLLKGEDIIACAQTGTGKTAAFIIPMLDKLMRLQSVNSNSIQIRALILAPTRELALQIGENIRLISACIDIRSTLIYGGVSTKRQIKDLRSGPTILVSTPGRLLDLMTQGYVNLSHIDMFVIDEFDRMLGLGMIQDVTKIVKALPKNRQNMFFSATMSEEVDRLIQNITTNPYIIKRKASISNSLDIKESVYFVNKQDKTSLLLSLLEDESLESVMVFVRTKWAADKLSKTINKMNIRSKSMHGDKNQLARQSILEMFRLKKIRVLVATDLAARGIDISKISHVINFDLPSSPNTYIHRVGRTGRAGYSGEAISFCSVYEVELLQAIEKEIKHKIIEIQDHLFLPEHLFFVRGRS